jgi:hypothetical protein
MVRPRRDGEPSPIMPTAIGLARGQKSRKPELILVTGCERNYFLMACLLMHTLRRWAPELPLYVLDFGMEEAQRRFLRAYCTVLDRPRELAPNLHPFVYKAAMAEFLRPIKWRSMAWLDCDMIAVGPLGERLAALMADMAEANHEVAIGRDSLPTIAAVLASGHNFAEFARAVREACIDGATPYYNTGLFVCRSPEFLAEWAKARRAAPLQVNFDQNLFNLTLHRRGAPSELDPRQWNVHGAMLARATVATGDPPALMVDGKPALILHATSSRREDITPVDSVAIDGVRLSGQLYLCRNPALHALQQAVMGEFFADMAGRFRRAGFGEAVAVGQ